MTDKLLPCPFCATEVSLFPQASGEGAFWIVCDAFQGGCGCEGPWVTKPEEAAAAWNGRDFSPMSIAAAVVTEMVSQAPAEISRGSRDVLAERRRQVEVEDFRIDEDDHYVSGEMAWAATCYLQNAAVAAKMQGLGLLTARECDERGKSLPKPEAWPWDAEWWKPSGQRRDLVKAAALIIAEIERIDRAAPILETDNEK